MLKWLRTNPPPKRESLSLYISTEDRLIEDARERIRRLREALDKEYPDERETQ